MSPHHSPAPPLPPALGSGSAPRSAHPSRATAAPSSARRISAALLLAALGMAPAACSKAKDPGAQPGSNGAEVAAAKDRGAPPSVSDPANAMPSAMRTYTLFWTVDKEPAGGVKVGIEVPSEWKETLDGMGGPSFTANGLSHGPDVVLLPANGADAKARVDALVQRQYDAAALSTAQREDAPDGSATWVSTQRPDGYVDARRFLAAPGDAGVVVCVVTLTPAEAARLPELKKVCHTMKLVP